MKLLFKQRFFSWFDSYDIYDEYDNTYFTVEGKLSWGHRFHIKNKKGEHIGTLKEQVFRFLPHFTMYENNIEIGEIIKEFTFFKPRFKLSCNDWKILGNFMEWNYEIISDSDGIIAKIDKELFHFTDHYTLNVTNEENALKVLMIVLAIDAIKCNQK